MDLHAIETRKDAEQFIKDVLIIYKQNGDSEAAFYSLIDLMTLITNKMSGKRPEQSLNEEITELTRELHLRGKVYPELIMSGKLRKKNAEEQNRRLISAIDRLKQIRTKRVGEQSALFLS